MSSSNAAEFLSRLNVAGSSASSPPRLAPRSQPQSQPDAVAAHVFAVVTQALKGFLSTALISEQVRASGSVPTAPTSSATRRPVHAPHKPDFTAPATAPRLSVEPVPTAIPLSDSRSDQFTPIMMETPVQAPPAHASSGLPPRRTQPPPAPLSAVKPALVPTLQAPQSSRSGPLSASGAGDSTPESRRSVSWTPSPAHIRDPADVLATLDKETVGVIACCCALFVNVGII